MEHSADEAGGEAIFTSDGLPSLSAPLPPPSSNSSNVVGIGTSAAADTDNNDIANNNNDAIISVEAVDQRVAFDTFQDAGTGWMGLSHPTKNNVTSVGPSGSGSSGVVGWEDPRRKLFQLKSEIDLLEKTLLEQQKRQVEEEDDESGENEELRSATLELKSKLTSLGLVNDASLSNMLRDRQVDLSMLITKDIEKFNTNTANDGGGNLSKDLENLSIKGEVGKEGDGDATTKMGNKIVYELYRDTTTTTTKSSSSSREVMLEERLRKLELALGSSAGAGVGVDGSSDKSIMERIEEAEKLTQQVDIQSIDKLAAKAKVIRADLEAAARAKTKLSSKSSSSNAAATASGQQQKEDAQMISRLHTQLLELDGISSYLPQLTIRLVELSNLHASASNFASRLNAAETAVNRCESMEGTLNIMEEGWKSNMDLIESNVRRLDELLANKT